jgi:hypothetical protein
LRCSVEWRIEKGGRRGRFIREEEALLEAHSR